MKVLFSLMVKILILVGLGVILKKCKVISDELQKGLSNLLVTAVLPLNIIASANQELTSQSVRGTIFTTVFSIIYYVGALVVITLLSKQLKMEEDKKKIFITMSVFANTGFIGFPLVEELFGINSVIYAVIYNMFYQLFFYTYGMYLISSQENNSLLNVFKTPVTISSFISIVIFLLQIKLPSPVQESFSSVGSMTVPLSMIIIGCMIANIKWKELWQDSFSYLVTGFRLLIFPALAFVILKLFQINGTVAGICILITGLPSGSLNAIMAEQENCEPEFAARTVIQSMIFMILTLPVLFIVIKSL